MDIESFLTGFLQSRGEAIKEQKSEAKDEEKRLRQLAMANASKVQQRKVVYDSATKMTQDLLKLGVPKDTVKAAVGSGKLDAVWKDVTAIQTQMGDEGVTKFLDTDPFSADLGTAEYSTIQEALATAYGMPQTGAKGDYKAPKVGPLGRLFGQGDYEKDRLAKLDEEQSLVEGMSTYDLANIGVLPTYIPGSQGESFAYTSPILYNNDTRDAAITRMQKSLELIGKNEELTKLSSDIKEFSTQLAEKGAKSDAIQSDDLYINLQNRLNTAKMAYANKFKEVGGDLLITEAERFFNSSAYYSDLAGLVKAYVPGAEAAGLVEALMEQSLTSKDEEDIVEQIESGASDVDPTVDPTVAPTTTQTDDITQTNVPPQKPAASPVVETGKTPSGVEFTKAEDGTISIDGKALSEEDQAEFLEAVKEEGLSLSRLDGKDGSQDSLRRYEDIYRGMMTLPEEQRSNYVDAAMDMADIPDIKEAVDYIVEKAPGAADTLGGKILGGTVWAVGMFNEGMGKAYAAITGDIATGAKQVAIGRDRREYANEIMADGIVQYLQQVADENGVTGGFGPDRAARVKRAALEHLGKRSVYNDLVDVQKRIQDYDKQDIADARNFPEGIGNRGDDPTIINPISFDRGPEANAEAELQQRIQDNDRQFIADARNFPEGIGNRGDDPTIINPAIFERPQATPEQQARAEALGEAYTQDRFDSEVAAADKADADAADDAKTATQKRIEAYDRQFLADARNFPRQSEGPSTGKRVAGIMSEAYADMGDKAEDAIIRLDRNAAKGVRNLHDQLTTALGNQVAREVNHLSKAFSWSGEPNKKTVEQQASMWADFKNGLVDTYQDIMKNMSQEELQAMLPEQLSSIIDVLNPTANLEPTKFVKVAQNIADQHGADSSTAKKANKLLNRLEENKPIAKNDVVALIIDTMKLPVEEDRQLLLNNLYSIYNAVSGE